MVRLTEMRITVRRGFANLGETNEAEVTAAFEIPEGANLGAVVEAKLHEVQRALHRALESEPPKEATTGMETEVQVAVPPEPPPAGQADEGEDSGLEPPFQVAEESADAAPSPGADGSEEPPITPAQERTIRSLCIAGGIGETEFRAMLEDGYGGKDADALTKREAAGLILQLTQKRREHILRDKPQVADPQQNYKTEQEAFPQNGGAP